MDIAQGFIDVEGGRLYYEIRGHGPPVLLVQGGLSEAGATARLAERLAGHYQVISYDRRGLSRSTVAGDEPPVTMSLHAQDAAALLETVTESPARVAGASIGAVIGLDLTVHHPDLVEVLVAHEPPMPALVRDPEQEAGLDEVADLARHDVTAALKHFVSLGGRRKESPEPDARPPDPVGDLQANLQRFFDTDFAAVRTARLDADALAAAAHQAPIIPTGGQDSQGGWEQRCAQQLADMLDRPLVTLPGGHNGLVSHPRASAAALTALFEEHAI